MYFLTLLLTSVYLVLGHQQQQAVVVSTYFPFEQHPCYGKPMLCGDGAPSDRGCPSAACCVCVQDANEEPDHDSNVVITQTDDQGHRIVVVTRSNDQVINPQTSHRLSSDASKTTTKPVVGGSATAEISIHTSSIVTGDETASNGIILTGQSTDSASMAGLMSSQKTGATTTAFISFPASSYLSTEDPTSETSTTPGVVSSAEASTASNTPSDSEAMTSVPTGTASDETTTSAHSVQLSTVTSREISSEATSSEATSSEEPTAISEKPIRPPGDGTASPEGTSSFEEPTSTPDEMTTSPEATTSPDATSSSAAETTSEEPVLIPPTPDPTAKRPIKSSCPTPTCSHGIEYALYDNPFSSDFTPTYESFSPENFKNTKPVFNETLHSAIYISDDRDAQGNFNPLFKNAAAGYRGYLFACQKGTYKFNSPYSDDITLMWFGAKAYEGYTRDNADIVQAFYGDNRPKNITRELQAGTYYPIRVLWGNTGGAADLSLRIYGPDDQDLSGADQAGEYYVTTAACDGSYRPWAPWGDEP